jgi:hypothetical protein
VTVEGNVFYDWANPYWDSFGLSIMAQTAKNTRVVNNYCRASRTGDFSTGDSSGVKRWGYGIEYGTNTGECSGNVVIGPWANHVICSTQGNLINNNRLYGRPTWQHMIGGEPGIGGKWGTPVDRDNLKEPDESKAPPPPAWAVARVSNPLGDAIQQPTLEAPANLKAVAGNRSVSLSWVSPANTEGIVVERRAGTGGYATIATVPGGTTTYTDDKFAEDQVKNTWVFFYRLTSVAGTAKSNPTGEVSAQIGMIKEKKIIKTEITTIHTYDDGTTETKTETKGAE